TVGGDYNRPDGRIQNADGTLIDAGRNGLMFGAGTGIGSAGVLSVTDAIFAPLVARQTVRARQADVQVAANDTLVAVSDAYFGVQQARGELAGAEDATRRTAELRVNLVDPGPSVDDLIVIGLTNRPELASRQAQVQATIAALRQERVRPLVPSVLIRGWSTPVTGTLAVGTFGGGRNGQLDNFGYRGDIDVQLLWQFDNLGFGNRGRVHQR